MGQTKVRKHNILAPSQNQALDAILNQSQANTNYIADYLKNIIEKGPSADFTQQAVDAYKSTIVPQILSNLGGGMSSSALNQALATGSQDLAKNLSAGSTMSALQMLQNLTQHGSQIGLGTQANINTLAPSRTSQILGGLGQLAGLGLGFAGQNIMPYIMPNLLQRWFPNLVGGGQRQPTIQP